MTHYEDLFTGFKDTLEIIRKHLAEDSTSGNIGLVNITENPGELPYLIRAMNDVMPETWSPVILTHTGREAVRHEQATGRPAKTIARIFLNGDRSTKDLQQIQSCGYNHFIVTDGTRLEKAVASLIADSGIPTTIFLQEWSGDTSPDASFGAPIAYRHDVTLGLHRAPEPHEPPQPPKGLFPRDPDIILDAIHRSLTGWLMDPNGKPVFWLRLQRSLWIAGQRALTTLHNQSSDLGYDNVWNNSLKTLSSEEPEAGGDLAIVMKSEAITRGTLDRLRESFKRVLLVTAEAGSINNSPLDDFSWPDLNVAVFEAYRTPEPVLYETPLCENGPLVAETRRGEASPFRISARRNAHKLGFSNGDVYLLQRLRWCLESGGNSPAAFSEHGDLGLIKPRGQG